MAECARPAAVTGMSVPSSLRAVSLSPALARAYFAIQGIAVLLWWGLLFVAPESRAYFARPDHGLLRLAGPDLLILGCGSLAVAATASRGWRPARLVLRWMTVWILLTIGWSVAVACTGGPVVGAVLMAGALGGTVLAGRAVTHGSLDSAIAPVRTFVEMQGATMGRAMLFTLAQIVVVWPLFLVVGPFVLVEAERILGVAPFVFPFRLTLGLVLFFVASVLNLHCAAVMARVGRGTPLPLACAPRLVIAGPYRFLRNPMAVFGLSQGAAIGICLGSWATLLYVLVGGLFWDLVVRPVEEADLLARFGADYERYRAAVSCWWPRWTPYRPEAAA